MPNYDNIVITSIIEERLYPIIEKAMDKYDSKFRSVVSNFFNKNHELLFDIAPYDRIYYNQKDIDELFAALQLKEDDIKLILSNAFYYDIPYNPPCAKEPYVIVVFLIIKYYLRKNKDKFAELATIYLAFTGKFYASIHSEFFRNFPPSKYKSVMDYVINNMLTDKFDLKKEGTVFGAIKSMCIKWLDTYKSKLKAKNDDKDVCGHIQQLRDREKAFMKNIAKLYYEAYNNKYYLNYETDSVDQDTFRITDNDASVAARLTENTMNYLTSNYVSLDICNKCKDQNVKASEIKEIIESILADNTNLPDIRRVVNTLICDFMREYPGAKVSSVDFIAYSLKAKPNTKDKYLLEMKQIILGWLDENSPNYRKRKSRKATAISYYKSILSYFVLTISKVAQKG